MPNSSSTTRKPNASARVNFSHEIARNLQACWLLNEGSGLIAHNIGKQPSNPQQSIGAGYTWAQGGVYSDGTSCTGTNINYSCTAANATLYARVFLPTGQTFKGDIIKVGSTGTGYGIDVGNANGTTLGTSVLGIYEGARWVNSAVSFVLGQVNDVALVVNASGFPTLYLNGNKIYSDSTGAPSAPIEPSELFCSGNATRPLTSTIRLDTACIWNRALSAGEILQLHKEPYCYILQPPPVKYFFAPSTITSFSYTMAGGLAVNGTASVAPRYLYPVGLDNDTNTTLAGSASVVPTYAYASAGGIATNGSASAILVNPLYPYTASGGIAVLGSAVSTFFLPSYNANGNVVISGTGLIQPTYLYSGSGTIAILGSATASLVSANLYTMVGGMAVNGTASVLPKYRYAFPDSIFNIAITGQATASIAGTLFTYTAGQTTNVATFFMRADQSGVQVPSGFLLAWGAQGTAGLALGTSAGSGQINTQSNGFATITGNAQFCSALLSGQTISTGNYTIAFAIDGNNSGVNTGEAALFLVNGQTNAIRTTILSQQAVGGNRGSGSETTAYSSTLSGSAWTSQQGDYLALEVGVHSNAGIGNNTFLWTNGTTAITTDSATTASAQSQMTTPVALVVGGGTGTILYGSAGVQLSYLYSASGNITTSGTAALKTKVAVVSQLGQEPQLKGLATAGINLTYLASGNIAISGSSSAIQTTPTFSYIATGSLAISGSVTNNLLLVSSAQGNVAITGSATASSQTTQSYTATGSITLIGSAGISLSVILSGTGYLQVSGIASYFLGVPTFSYSGTGNILLSGSAVAQLSQVSYSYVASGSIATSGQANGQLSQIAVSTGSLTLSNGASIGQTYVPYLATGNLSLTSLAGVSSPNTWVSTGGIALNGQANLTAKYIYLASGTIRVSGLAAINYVASGRVRIAGSAKCFPIYYPTVSLGKELTLSSSPINTLPRTYTMQGGIVLNGATKTFIRLPVVAKGTLRISGFAKAVQVRQLATGGSLTLSGQAVSKPIFKYLASGKVHLSGAITPIGKYVYQASGKIHIAGTGIGSIQRTRIATGGLTLSGSALIAHKSVYISKGGIHLTGISTVNENGAEQASGRMRLSGSAKVSFATFVYIASGKITISGSVPNTKKNVYQGSGGIRLSGTSIVRPSYLYVAGGKIHLSGNIYATQISGTVSNFCGVGDRICSTRKQIVKNKRNQKTT